MQTFFRIAAIFFGLGTIGSLLDGDLHPLVIVITVVCTYFGWMHEFSKNENTEENRKLDFQKADEDLKPASEIFSVAQKHALICCLYIVAVGDDELHSLEQEFISKVATNLQYNGLDEVKILLSIENNRDMIIEIVCGFDDYQRNYFMRCLDEIIRADGLELEMEFVYARSILESAGIDFGNYLIVNDRSNPFNDDAHKRNWKTSFNETQKKAMLSIIYSIAVDEKLEFSDITSRAFSMFMSMLGCRYQVIDLQQFVNSLDRDVTRIVYGMGEQQKKVFLKLASSMSRARELDIDQILEVDLLIKQCGICSDEFMNEYYKSD